MDMTIPPSTSLEGSWRMDDLTRRSHGDALGLGLGKESERDREIVWDVQGHGHDNRHGNDYVYGKSTSIPGINGTYPSSSGPAPVPLGKGKNVQKSDDDRGPGSGPLTTHVLAKVMDTSRGRDKVLKCLQYSLKTYLYLLTLVARVKPLSPWFRSNSKRMKLAISGLSLARKCMLLLNPLHPLTDLLSPEPMSPRTLVAHLIDLFSALSDDVFCLSRLGLVGKKAGVIADKWSNRLWLLTTIMGLYKMHLKTIPKLVNSSSTSAEQRKKGLIDAKWTNRKLLADLAFVSYDVFELNWPVFEEPMKCLTGLLAGYISATKLYDQQWESSVGKG